MTPYTMKNCRKCLIDKPIEYFSKAKRNNDCLHSYCKECMLEYSKQWVESKGGIEYSREVHYQSTYGISYQHVLDLIKNQDGKCALCEAKVSLHRGGGFKHKAHVDHCHTTNKIRGILCGNCNTALGKLGDDVKSIQKVLEYLKGEQNVQTITQERKFPKESTQGVSNLRGGSNGNSEVSPYAPWPRAS